MFIKVADLPLRTLVFVTFSKTNASGTASSMTSLRIEAPEHKRAVKYNLRTPVDLGSI
jgi:hypothetical protein